MTTIRSTVRPFLIMGLTGLTISLVMNLAALYFFKRQAAEFFNEPWWTTWFPSYSVWLAFAIIGLGSRISHRQ